MRVFLCKLGGVMTVVAKEGGNESCTRCSWHHVYFIRHVWVIA